MKKISRRNFIPLFGTALLGASCISLDESLPIEMGKRIYPRKLRKGDTIGVCAPAGGIKDPVEVKEFQSKLEGYGFNVKFSEDIYDRYGYFASDDKQRAASFMQLIEDKSVNAIFFIRGGWGCARILEYLSFDAIQSNAKIIMGFSDITTLLNVITYKTGLVTFHGPGGNSSWNDFSWNSIQSLIMNAETVSYSIPSKEYLDLNPVTINGGKAEGELYGGNLSVLSGLLGSKYLPDWNEKILFLEDVMEEPYRIDRMLTQFKLNGVFDQINGLVLGQFRKCIPEEKDRSFTIDEVFQQHFKDLSIPVYSGASIGHIKYKHTIPVGAMVKLDADLQQFKLIEPAVI